MRPLAFALLALGAAAALVQFSLIRELLGAFGGNEYLVGISLGCWLLFSGAGSLAARAGPIHRQWWLVSILFMILACVAVASIVALRWARFHLFLPGSTLGLHQQIVVTAVAELPYCFLSGWALVACAQRLVELREERGLPLSYLLDSLGAIVAGLAFAFVLSWWFGHVQIAAVAGGLLILGAAAVIGLPKQLRIARWPVAGVVAGGLLLLSSHFDAASLRWLVPTGEVVFEARSAYGQIVVTESFGQRTYYRNGSHLHTTDVPELAEPLVQIPLHIHPKPRRVVVIGLPTQDVGCELTKHPLEEVIFLEPDKVLLEALSAAGDAWVAPNARVKHEDARTYFARHRGVFDVILLDRPAPQTVLDNRYFTREFAHLARQALRPGGIVALELIPYSPYLTTEQAQFLSAVAGAFGQEFSHVWLVPTDIVRLIASNEPIAKNVAEAVDERGTTVTYVSPAYLLVQLDPSRQAAVDRALAETAPANSDLKPFAAHVVLSRWLRQYNFRFGALELILVGVLVFMIVRLRREEVPVFAAGFAGAGLEYIVLLAVQTAAGTLYSVTAWLVTLFMIGLVLGTHFGNVAMPSIRKLRFLLGAFAFLALLHGAVMWATSAAGGRGATWLPITCVTLVFSCLVFADGLATGAVFAVGARTVTLGVPQRPASLYCADFIGGALGSVLVSCYLLPVEGTVPAVVAVGGLLMVAAFIFPAKKIGRASRG